MKRDTFLKVSGAFGAGLTLGLGSGAAGAAPAGLFEPNAYVKIAPENAVTIYCSKSEMGQGIAMGLSTVVAEELDYPVDRARIEFAIAAPQYADPVGKEQGTGGSTSTDHMFDEMRKMGAAARAMLVAAAAQQWGVPPSSLVTNGEGFVTHPPSGRSASYGELALLAALQPVPKDVPLKAPGAYRQIGKRLARYDVPSKVNGRAKYGMDVRIPGMLYASVQRPAVFGGRVTGYDATDALKVKGVKKVVQISRGVAVIATDSWSAMQGRYKLKVAYDDGPNANLSSAAIFAQAAALTKQPGAVAKSAGNAAAALASPAHKTYSALFHGPYLAHAAMEPMNATAWMHDGVCEVWAPTQGQTQALDVTSEVSGLPKSACTVYTTFLGGGFGRKSESDAVREAVEIAKATGLPVKVVYTREDDMQHDFYRSANTTAIAAALDSSGKIAGMTQRVVASSVFRRTRPERFKGGLDVGATRGASDLPYAIPNLLVDFVDYEPGIPVGYWRAPGGNWGTFVTESFMDELAHAAGADPYAFRRAHLTDPRSLAVLDAAAQKAGWGKPLPAGRYRGLAMGVWGGSQTAMIAEISVAGKMPRVHRLVIASDTGLVINPDIVEAQLQSAANYGLAAALTGKITIEKGRVAQNNFYDYTVLRHDQAPHIETVILPSTAHPTGVGELSTPPVAPAVANAWFAATGKRLRSLPFSDAASA